MGMSSSTSKNKPIYKSQIEGASTTLGNAYNAAAPEVQKNADAISSLVPSLLERYTKGDDTVNAAQGYAQNVLSGNGSYSYTPDAYLQSVINGSAHNTSLADMIAMTNRSVAQGLSANLGTRGLAGGTVEQNILSKAMAQNTTGLLYQDFTNQEARQDQAALTETQRRDQAMQLAGQEKAGAAGLSASLLGAQESLLDPALTAANAATVPFTLASNYASGTGGLLGQYQKTKTTTPWGPVLAGAASNAAGAYFGAGG